MKKILTIIIYILIILIEFSGSSSLNSYTNIALFLLPIVSFLYQLLSEKKEGKIMINLKNSSIKVLLIFSYYILLCLFYTFDFNSSIAYIIKFTACIMFVLFCCRTQVFWDKLKNILFYSSMFVAVTILLTTVFPNFFVEHTPFLLPTTSGSLQMYFSELRQGIYSGILFERAYAAFSLNIGICCFMAEYFSDIKIKKLKIVGFVLILIALFCTGKRTLFLIPITSFIVLSILNNKNKKIFFNILKYLPIFIILILLMFKFVPSATKVFERFSSNENSTMDTRSDSFWNYAIDMFQDKPLLGYGIGTYKSYISQHRTEQIYDAHNIYLQILGETGAIGFVLFIIVLVTNYISNIKLLKKCKEKKQIMLINFSLCIQNLFLIYGLTGNPMYYFSQLLMYLITFAITASVITKGIDVNESEEKNRNCYVS